MEKKSRLWFYVGMLLLGLVFVYGAPMTFFSSPTPANATVTTNTSLLINTSITGGQLGSVIYNWNGTNYSLFNKSVLGMYSFDDYSLMNDSSWQGNNGSCSSCPTHNASGKYGASYTFNGSQYINITGLAGKLDDAVGGTITWWSYSNQPYNDNQERGWWGWTASGVGEFDCFKYSDNMLYCGWADGSDYRVSVAASAENFPTKTWSQYALTWQTGAKAQLYHNGVLIGTAAQNTVTINSDKPFFIGSVQNNSALRNWNGSIDEMMIWNTTLSAQEIYQQYIAHLQQVNASQWYLTVNQSKNATAGLVDGTYTYRVFAQDRFGSGNMTEERTITIQATDTSYPWFSDFQDNNGTIVNTGLAIFNVTVQETNGTVYLSINGTNHTAQETTPGVYNYSLTLTNGTYAYQWVAFGNGSAHNRNISGIRYYTVNYSSMVAADDYVNASTQVTVSLNLTGNDYGTDIIVGSINQPAHGTVVNKYDGTVDYTSDVGFVGVDNFTYELTVQGSKEFNGHYYEYIASPGMTWPNANISASSRTLNGLQGYLVTVTSVEENNFIQQKLGGDSWMGAGDPYVEGTWRWLTGPEAGTQFWSGAADGSTVGGKYANWAPSEPNDYGTGEDYAHFYANNGEWNDFAFDNGGIAGYVVEYGGLPGDNPVFSSARVEVTVTDQTAPAVTLQSPAQNYYNDSGSPLNITFTCSATDNVALANISLYSTNATNQSFALQQSTSVNGTSNSTSWVINLSNGNYTWNCLGYDTSGNYYWGANRSLRINYTPPPDADHDGLPDSTDPLWYNESNVTTSGVTRLNITVDGNATNESYSGVEEVRFYDGQTILFNFSHNFTQSDLDLSKVKITKTTTSLVINLSGQLQGNKTVYITDNNFIKLCVKDAQVSSIAEVSAGCDGVNETDFTSCLGGSATIGGLTCTDLGSTIRVEHLRHSAIVGTQATPSPSGGSSSSHSMNIYVVKACTDEPIGLTVSALNNKSLETAEISVYKGNTTNLDERVKHYFISLADPQEVTNALSSSFSLTENGTYTLFVESAGYYAVKYAFAIEDCVKGITIAMEPEKPAANNITTTTSGVQPTSDEQQDNASAAPMEPLAPALPSKEKKPVWLLLVGVVLIVAGYIIIIVRKKRKERESKKGSS